MEGKGNLLISKEIRAGGKIYLLSIEEEDLSRLYPGMTRYTLRLASGGETLGLLRTNSYEYSPTVPLSAEGVIRGKAAEWERALLKDPDGFLASVGRPGEEGAPAGEVEALIIQGSPRADGNCSIFAGWAAEEAGNLGKRARVVYLDDLTLRPCIACYQCYNTGTCTFDDDMTDLIGALRSASLLVVCTPVYTNTVPGALKIFIDRCQAYHAEKNLFRAGGEKKGILLSVAGRTGADNFDCVKRVVVSFMRNLGIRYAGEILLDGMDGIRDIRTLPGIHEKIGGLVRDAFRR
ncbi:MAG: flavodoxin family protein [Methanomicrobiales archaeon]|nr:flavodoxin family protein [Methanomicrobiales archaeon]